jgi:carboxylesterase type B
MNAVAKTARDLTRDAAFGWHSWTWARLQSRTGKSKVFYYYFDQHLDYPEGSPKFGYGAGHAADVAYVFQHLDPKNPEYDKTDSEISEAHVQLLGQLRQAWRPQRRRTSHVARVRRRKPARDAFQQDTA